MDFEYVREETVGSVSLAARLGNLPLLKTLISRGSSDSVRQCDNRGWQPIHEAAHGGHGACVSYLGGLESCDLNSRTWEGETALLLACKQLPETRQAVHALLKCRAKVNIPNHEDCSPLQYAAVKADPQVVRWLVRKGAQVSASNVWGETALHCALKKTGADHANRLSIVKYLVKHGGEVFARDENWLTPLMLAAQKGLGDICSLFLETCPTIVNQQAEDGATAIMLAAQGGHLHCVDLLLSHGADVNKTADDGTMALHSACIAKSNSPQILERLMPKTDLALVYPTTNICNRESCLRDSVCERKYCGPVTTVSPFHLAIDWDNLASIPVLNTYFQSERFLMKIEDAPLHSEFCISKSLGFCEMKFKHTTPLAHLLTRLAGGEGEEGDEQLLLATVTLLLGSGSRAPSKSLPPLLALMIGTRYDRCSFEEGGTNRKILKLLLEKGEMADQHLLLRVLLLGNIHGLVALLKEGVFSARFLVHSFAQHEQQVRSILNQGFSWEQFEPFTTTTILAPRLIAFTLTVAKCGMLRRENLLSFHDIIWSQLREFRISKVEILDNLYSELRQPKSLKSLARRTIHRCLAGLPRLSVPQLPLPPTLLSFLLFSDVDSDAICHSHRKLGRLIRQHSTML